MLLKILKWKGVIVVGKKDDRINETRVNIDGEKMIVVRYGNCDDIDVQFDDGTIVEHKTYGNFKKGNIKNPYFPTVCGVGFIGKGKFKPYDENGKPTKCYRVWERMIQRCYSPKYQEKRPTYKGCTVCKEWWNFQVFAQWFYEHYYEFGNEPMALDKDILKKANKTYAPSTCVFVPQSINSLFTKCDKTRGNLPIGVSKNGNKFRTQLNKGNGKPMYLGIFNTPEEAFLVYKQAKEAYIKEVAEKYKGQIDNRAYEALINYEVEIDD